MSMTALAGQWTSDSIGWHYDKTENGNFAVNEWLWIDGNGDGIAESYCFDGTSFMYANTITPDGYTVNENGAWTIDGVVQTKQVDTTEIPQDTETASVHIKDLTPVKSYYGVKTEDSIKDDFGNLYSNTSIIDCRRGWGDCYSIYYNADNYTKLKADNIAMKKWAADAEAEEITIAIYDGSTDELLDSIIITPTTTDASLDVDITGHELIRINASVTSKRGYSAGIIFRNLRFSK